LVISTSSRMGFQSFLKMLTLALSSISIIDDSITSESAVWTDDSVISFDEDRGWKIFECTDSVCDSMKPFCSDTSQCQRRDHSERVYYGPFNNHINDEKYIQRRFACSETSEVSIELQVSSCNAEGLKNEDDLTIWIHGAKVIKTTIESSAGAIIENDGTLTEDGCSSYFDQTISSADSSKTPTVTAKERFTVRLRHRTQETAQSYIHDIKITCDPTGDNSTYDGSNEPATQHDEYCVSGFSGDLEALNGEYPLFLDAGEEPVEDANGYYYFNKNDLNGESFLYLVDDSRWVIGDTLNCDEWLFQCGDLVDAADGGHDYWLDIADLDCNSSASFEEGECSDQHTTISSVWDPVIIREVKDWIDDDENTFEIVAVAVLLSVSMSMFCAIACCLYHRSERRLYGKVVLFEEESEMDEEEEICSV